MNFTVRNKKIKVQDVFVGGIGNASLFLIGDAEVVTSSSVFDTPKDSLIYSPNIPIFPLQSEALEVERFFQEE